MNKGAVSEKLFEAKQKTRDIKINADRILSRLTQLEYNTDKDNIPAILDILTQIKKSYDEVKEGIREIKEMI